MPFPYGGLLAQAIAQEEARQKGLLGSSLSDLASTPPAQKGILQMALERGLPMDGRATFLPFQDTLPGSVMNERSWALPGLLASAWNAFTAPERVRKGFLDPNSEEAIGEAMNVAGMAMLPGLGKVATGARAPAGQFGANVYHGSPHKFDAFDASKIGTGEGAQAYGHGLYLADSPSVAKSYRPSAKQEPSYISSARNALEDPAFGTSLEEKVNSLNAIGNKQAAEYLRRNAEALEGSFGNLYKVDLPDEMIGRMLDWDRPLNQQSLPIPKLRAQRAQDYDNPWVVFFGDRPVHSFPTRKAADAFADSATGGDLVHMLDPMTGSPGASGLLRELGIPGIRYLDQGSRTAGKGTYNYVVFPGEEKALKILERK